MVLDTFVFLFLPKDGEGSTAAQATSQGQHETGQGASSQAYAIGRGRRATFGGASPQGNLWTTGFTGSNVIGQERGQQVAAAAAGYASSRYGRVSVAAGIGSTQARPPMRRTRSSILSDVGTMSPGRYRGHDTRQQPLHLDMPSPTQPTAEQSYQARRQMPGKQTSNASLFSRGAPATTQRFIAMPQDTLNEEQDDDVFAPNTWVSWGNL